MSPALACGCSWGSWVALCSSRSTPIWAVSSARGCVADWDWRLMGQCCVFRQLHTDLATILVLESRATAPLPPKAVEDGGSRARRARCLLGALMRTFVLRGSNPRPGFSPFRESSLRYAIALSRSSHCVWRRHSSHSLVVLLLHWYDASAALQRTTACCCSGRDRNCEDRVGIGPRLDCVNVGYGELHWVNFDAGSNAHIGWLPFARSLPLRSVRFGPFDRIPRQRGRRLPSLLWSQSCLHSA